MKQHKHTINFVTYAMGIYALIAIPTWLICEFVIREYYPDLISEIFNISVIVFEIILGVFVTFVIRQSYLQFRDKHEKHVEKLNKAIVEVFDNCEIIHSGHSMNLCYIKPEEHPLMNVGRTQADLPKYWEQAVNHFNTGKTHKEIAEIYTLLTLEIENYNLHGSKAFSYIDETVLKELEETFPDFIYELKGKNCILKDTIVEYIWIKHWFPKPKNSTPAPINFKIEKVHSGKPSMFISSKIYIDGFANLLASYSSEIDIEIKLKNFIEKMVENDEFKQLILIVLEKRETTDETFKKFKNELEKVSNDIDSNKDIDGKCEFCPRMLF